MIKNNNKKRKSSYMNKGTRKRKDDFIMSVNNKTNANVQKKNKKKGGIIALFLIALMTGCVFFGNNRNIKDDSFDTTILENLMDLDYEVVSANENEDTEKFEVVIQTEEPQKELVELAEEFKTIVEEEIGETINLGVHVYSKPTQESVTEEGATAEDAPEKTEDYREYIEVTETITVTNAIEMGDLKGEAAITKEWELHTWVSKPSYKTIMFDFNKEVAKEDLKDEVIFKQLKGIYAVMEKHNEDWTQDVTAAIINESEDATYAYTAKHPTKLFVTEEVEVTKVTEK